MASVWLRRAAVEIARAVFAPVGVDLKIEQVDISFGYPIKMQRVSYRDGVRQFVGGVAIGTSAIVIPPQRDPVFVLGALAHEMIHIAVPEDANHGRRFQRISDAIGLVPPYASTTPSDELKATLMAIVVRLGPMPTPFDATPATRRAFVERSDGSFVIPDLPEPWAPPRKTSKKTA